MNYYRNDNNKGLSSLYPVKVDDDDDEINGYLSRNHRLEELGLATNRLTIG